MTTEPTLMFGKAEYEQPELPLEWPVYDHYTIELRKGNPPGEMEVLKQHTATTTIDAIGIIESMRDRTAFRDKVVWRDREVDGNGDLYGLVKGVTWQIHVTPDLNTGIAADEPAN